MIEKQFEQWLREPVEDIKKIDNKSQELFSDTWIKAAVRQKNGRVWAIGKSLCFKDSVDCIKWQQVEPLQSDYEIKVDSSHEEISQIMKEAGSNQPDIEMMSQYGLSIIRSFTFPDASVRGLALDESDHLWIATSEGLVTGSGDGSWYTFGPLDHLPCKDLQGVTVGEDGSIWIWYKTGVSRLNEGKWLTFSGSRWLTPGSVLDFFINKDNSVFVKTEEGKVRLYQNNLNFAEKADFYEAQIELRHKRNGYVTHCQVDFDEKSLKLKSHTNVASDNDGLWTAMYLAAESYRYAVTKDESVRKIASGSMQALRFMEEVTPISGYPARAVVFENEKVLRSDPETGEWNLFTHSDGRSGQWKGDCSSDEIIGHFYGLSIYHDLVADDSEKAEITETLTKIADHLLDNDLFLVDLDGKPTKWGVWNPENVKSELFRMGDRGLNSLEILAILKISHEISGEKRFALKYEDLIKNHGFAINTIQQRHKISGHTNHSDDELAFISYYPLLKYEKDPALRAIYLRSLERTWTYVRPTESPMWTIMYKAMTGNYVNMESAAEQLMEIPLDLISYRTDQTWRYDLKIRSYLDRHGNEQAEEFLNWHERPLMQWNENPYRAKAHDTTSEEAGYLWLLPYWMGRFYSFIN